MPCRSESKWKGWGVRRGSESGSGTREAAVAAGTVELGLEARSVVVVVRAFLAALPREGGLLRRLGGILGCGDEDNVGLEVEMK
jgi:hypothetical protein